MAESNKGNIQCISVDIGGENNHDVLTILVLRWIDAMKVCRETSDFH